MPERVTAHTPAESGASGRGEPGRFPLRATESAAGANTEKVMDESAALITGEATLGRKPRASCAEAGTAARQAMEMARGRGECFMVGV